MMQRQADGLFHDTKVPGDEVDWGIDWSKELPNPETGSPRTILTYGFAVQTGLTAGSAGVVGVSTVVRLSGGTAGQSYYVTGHVVLSDGTRLECTLVIDVVARRS